MLYTDTRSLLSEATYVTLALPRPVSDLGWMCLLAACTGLVTATRSSEAPPQARACGKGGWGCVRQKRLCVIIHMGRFALDLRHGVRAYVWGGFANIAWFGPGVLFFWRPRRLQYVGALVCPPLLFRCCAVSSSGGGSKSPLHARAHP